MTTPESDIQSPNSQSSTAFLTDMYELTMLDASMKDGTYSRECVFEVFGRKLPNERRYGVVAGTGRLIEAIRKFRFTEEQIALADFLSEKTKDFLRNYRFGGQIDGGTMLNYIVVGYLFKVSVEAVLLPVTYRVISLVRSREPELTKV